MKVKSISTWAGAVMIAALFAQASLAAAQTPARDEMAAKTVQSLGTVMIPAGVTANGQPLARGSYTVRLTTEKATPVVGQAPDSEQWVEFVQGGQVKGKELATVVTAPDIKQIAEMTPPASGTAKVQTLKGADYLRVWINRGGTHYLVHLNAKQ